MVVLFYIAPFCVRFVRHLRGNYNLKIKSKKSIIKTFDSLFSFDCRFVIKYWQKVEKCNPKVGANWEVLHIGVARGGCTLELWGFGGVGKVGRCAILYIWYGRAAKVAKGFLWCGWRSGGEGMGVRRALGSTNWGNSEIFSAKVVGRLRKFATFDSVTLN